MSYAGFWFRFVAWFIDVMIVNCGVWVMQLVLGAALGPLGIPLIILLGLFAPWLYFASMESSDRQATLGKLAVGIRVTDLDGATRISFPRATVRHFAKILSTLILLVGYLMAGFTERKQALHDILARTLVVKRPAGAPVPA
jgi:uncharacterized RDD family membrane protein YckC